MLATSTAMRAQRQAAAFAAKHRATGLVDFASMPTRGNPDVKRDDAHPLPKGLVGAGIKERIPLRRPDDLTRLQEGLRKAGLPE
jgi:hypothetical protein